MLGSTFVGPAVAAPSGRAGTTSEAVPAGLRAALQSSEIGIETGRITAGAATCTVQLASAGTYKFAASYSGDATHSASITPHTTSVSVIRVRAIKVKPP
jgi:hypothetical protein